MTEARREVPRTDTLLADPRLQAALAQHRRETVKAAVVAAQERCRVGEIAATEVVDAALAALRRGLRDVLNATGVVLHTNLGRAPLSDQARAAVDRAARGYVDLELDLATGRRAARGRSTIDALRGRVPDAESAAVVNNGAAALVLAALAVGGDLVVSRGELVEIGDGFRLTTILASAGVRLREVGSTNRTTVADYRSALDGATGVLKVHPSNFSVVGFTGSVGVRDLAALGVPVVADLGSGLLAADPLLPDEPDVASALKAGAALVTCSGDKLLGGPQAGLVLGRADLVERVRRHPLARAMRADKLALAALEATLLGGGTPVQEALAATDLLARAERIAAAIPGARAVETDGAVGGGSGPGVPLPSAAVSLPEAYAEPLRLGDPAVVGRVHRGRLLLDLRAVPAGRDAELVEAVRAVLER